MEEVEEVAPEVDQEAVGLVALSRSEGAAIRIAHCSFADALQVEPTERMVLTGDQVEPVATAQ